MKRYLCGTLLMVVIASSGVGLAQPPSSLSAEELQRSRVEMQERQAKDDMVTEHLFRQYICVNGKITTSSVRAAIELVAARGDHERFRPLLMEELEKSCQEGGSRVVRQNLLSTLQKMLASHRHGGARWHYEQKQQAQRDGKEVFPSAVIQPVSDQALYQNSPMLKRVIELAYQADSADIDHFVLVVRQAHHPQSKAFLLDVLQNPESTIAPTSPAGGGAARQRQAKSIWSDGQGGSWRDAKFHAAVGLAELGEPAGVEWLIACAVPNDFGLDDSVYRVQHFHSRRGSLRENAHLALLDLFGLDANVSNSDWPEIWKSQQSKFTPKQVMLNLD